MTRPLLHFSHANGFPAPCYRAFLAPLEARFEIRYLERLGHDAAYLVQDGWHALTDELIAALVAHGRPAVLVGHSLGAYLSLRAAVRRPELVRSVVLLDAPVLSPFKGGAVALLKRLGVADAISPAPGTRRRRREWASPEEALAHFRSRPVFRRFDPRCLLDYVHHGTEQVDGVTRLRFDPEVEYRIYRTMPHDLARDAPLLRVPAGLLVGQRSEIARRVGLGFSRRWMKVGQTPGGHLFPFQHPETSAQAVLHMLGELGLAH
jgi:pimeloyl-ACP methyl ester carboxylesterase